MLSRLKSEIFKPILNFKFLLDRIVLSNLKLKSIQYSLIGLSFAVISCSHKETNEYSHIFISDPLQNRIIDDGKMQKHDKNCIGFYTNHFNPKSIDGSKVISGADTYLNKVTGLKWKKYSQIDSIINFNHIFDDNTNKVVYLIELIDSPDDDKKLLSLGSDDGIFLWENGDSLLCSHKGRNNEPFSDLCELTLRKGVNYLIYKIDQGDGGWGLYRKFITKDYLRSLYQKNVYKLYSDLPNECIINDTASYLRLKYDNRFKYDTFHEINFIWDNTNYAKKRAQNFITLNANQIPSRLQTPRLNRFSPHELDIQVNDIENNDLVFRERIPIFYNEYIKNYLNSITTLPNRKDESNIARLEAVKEIFGNILNIENARNYSTRMMSHALNDYRLGELNLNLFRIPGPHTDGYRSEADLSIQPYRIFIPEMILSDKYLCDYSLPVIFIIHGLYTENNDQNFWQSYEGFSHALFAKRSALSTINNVLLVMSYGRGSKNYMGIAEEEIPLIFSQIKLKFENISDSLSLLTWSKGTISLLNLLENLKLPVNKIGLISPVFSGGELKMQQILLKLKLLYPNIRWFIRHGLDDEDSPIYQTRIWISFLEKNSFRYNYKEIPYSSHWNYIQDVEFEFYKWINQSYNEID